MRLKQFQQKWIPVLRSELRHIAAIALLSSALPVGAEDFRLSLPLDCEIGRTCFIEDYVDQDPAQGAQRDFACGINSRDGHRGTDFALLSFEAMDMGVDVRAAAPGTVLRIRDGMPDDRLMRGVTSDNACGNAVMVDHGDGWQVLYCHLKQGSVSVQPGDEVARGDAIGQVGLSGQTNHPHVHITVLRDGALVDPFQPGAQDTCGAPGETLFIDPPAYTPTGLVTAGFADRVPTLDEVRSGAARLERGRRDAPLVVYGYAGHAKHGDLLTLSASGPQGNVFEQKIVLKAPQIATMRAFGKKAPKGGWPTGEYLGEAMLTRQGKVIAHRFAHVGIE